MIVSKEYLCISKEFDKLIISLTAYANEYTLRQGRKKQTSYSDSFDALRLALNSLVKCSKMK